MTRGRADRVETEFDIPRTVAGHRRESCVIVAIITDATERWASEFRGKGGAACTVHLERIRTQADSPNSPLACVTWRRQWLLGLAVMVAYAFEGDDLGNM